MTKKQREGRTLLRAQKFLSVFLLAAIIFASIPVIGHAETLNLEPRNDLTQEVEKMAGNFWGVVKGLLWAAFAVVVIIAAFHFLGGSGDSRRIEKGRNMLMYGVVFLILALYADRIVGAIRYVLGG